MTDPENETPPIATVPVVTISVEVLDAFLASQRRTFKSLVWFVLVSLAIMGALVGFVVYRSHQSQQRQNAASQKQQATSLCIAQHVGRTLGFAFDALSAPPAPPNATPEQLAKSPRGIAVTEGRREVKKLEHIENHC